MIDAVLETLCMPPPEQAAEDIACLRRQLADLHNIISVLERQHKTTIYALERRIMALEAKK